jgi:hypothetical protein
MQAAATCRIIDLLISDLQIACASPEQGSSPRTSQDMK